MSIGRLKQRGAGAWDSMSFSKVLNGNLRPFYVYNALNAKRQMIKAKTAVVVAKNRVAEISSSAAWSQLKSISRRFEMKSKYCLRILFSLILLQFIFSACQTQVADIRVTIGNQTNEADSSESSEASEPDQTPSCNDDNGRAWPSILLFIIGIPLSAIGIFTLYIFFREVRKRKTNMP